MVKNMLNFYTQEKYHHCNGHGKNTMFQRVDDATRTLYMNLIKINSQNPQELVPLRSKFVLVPSADGGKDDDAILLEPQHVKLIDLETLEKVTDESKSYCIFDYIHQSSDTYLVGLSMDRTLVKKARLLNCGKIMDLWKNVFVKQWRYLSASDDNEILRRLEDKLSKFQKTEESLVIQAMIDRHQSGYLSGVILVLGKAHYSAPQ